MLECMVVPDRRLMAVFADPWRGQEAESRGKKNVSVYDCLSQFEQREQLQESEMWYCNRCKEHRQAWKEMRLWSAPPILVRETRPCSDGSGSSLLRLSYVQHWGV